MYFHRSSSFWICTRLYRVQCVPQSEGVSGNVTCLHTRLPSEFPGITYLLRHRFDHPPTRFTVVVHPCGILTSLGPRPWHLGREKHTICSHMRLVSSMRCISPSFISTSRDASWWLSAVSRAASRSAASLSARRLCIVIVIYYVIHMYAVQLDVLWIDGQGRV